MSIAGNIEIVVSARVPRGQRPVYELLVQSVGLGCEWNDKAPL